MEKYRRVPKERDNVVVPNEIRITNKVRKGQSVDYVENAVTLFEKFETIQLKAMGGAIPETVMTGELIKRKVAGLHQICKVESSTIVDVYEPLEEGLRQVINERQVSSVTIILSKKPLDKNDIGYQAPLTEDERSEPVTIDNPAARTKRRKPRKPKKTPNNSAEEKEKASPDKGEDSPTKKPKKRNRRPNRGRKRGAKNDDILTLDEDEENAETKNTQSNRGNSKRRGRGRGKRGRGRRGRGRGSKRSNSSENPENSEVAPGAPVSPPPVAGVERPPAN